MVLVVQLQMLCLVLLHLVMELQVQQVQQDILQAEAEAEVKVQELLLVQVGPVGAVLEDSILVLVQLEQSILVVELVVQVELLQVV